MNSYLSLQMAKDRSAEFQRASAGLSRAERTADTPAPSRRGLRRPRTKWFALRLKPTA